MPHPAFRPPVPVGYGSWATESRGLVEVHVQAPLLAGIDIGTTNTKVGIFDSAGAVVAADSRATSGQPGHLTDGICAALHECIRSAGRPPAAVGVTSMAESGVAVDADLAPMDRLVRWDEPHGAEQAAWLDAEIGAVRLWRRSGINLGVKTPLSRWLWLRSTRPGLIESMRFWLSAADLVVARLCGTAMTDPTLAARTGAFDLASGDWSAETLEQVGVHPDLLPPFAGLARSEDIAGLPAGTPVVIAGHDHLVAAYAAGARDPGQIVDSMGTAEALVTITGSAPSAEHATSGVSWNRTADGSHFCLLSGFPGSGRLAEWFSTRFAGDVAEFERLAGSVERAPTGIVVEPYLIGRAAPEPDMGRRVRISNLTERHDIADLALAVLEGASFHARWIAEEQARIAGSTVDGIHVFGGPTRSDSWMRAKAAIMPGGINVVRTADLATVGAALIAGVRCRLIDTAPVLPAVARTASAELTDAYAALYRTQFLPRARSQEVRSDV